MHYCLDPKKFKKALLEAGYGNLSDFSSKSKIHRNTLQGLLAGREIFVSSFLMLAKQLQKNPLELLSTKSSLPNIQHVDELASILAQLSQKDKNLVIVLLGSRAREKANTYSDWDIGLFRYPNSLSGREYLRLKREVETLAEEQNVVRKIDLINLNQAPLWFLKELKNEALLLEGSKQAFLYLKGMLDGIQKEQVA